MKRERQNIKNQFRKASEERLMQLAKTSKQRAKMLEVLFKWYATIDETDPYELFAIKKFRVWV